METTRMHIADADHQRARIAPMRVANWHFRLDQLSQLLERRWQRSQGSVGDREIDELRGDWSDTRVAFEQALHAHAR
jgi:hypothetical protein